MSRLIDYEMLTDKDGKRTVGFGWFAGGPLGFSSYFGTLLFFFFFKIISELLNLTDINETVAGALESFSAMAHSHLELGVASPFLASFAHFFGILRNPQLSLSVYPSSAHASLLNCVTWQSQKYR